MRDEFSEYYAEFLDGTYDCIDRIVLNGYFRLGQGPGGFRIWWRSLEGSDEHLDNAPLMRMAGRFSRRVRGYAKAQQIPLLDCGAGERKDEIAESYLPKDPNFTGMFLILVGRAPGPVWDVQHSKNGKSLNLVRKKPWPYVNHYSFHIIDPDWGQLIIKLCGHPPFNAQIILNGHEYVARQAQREGIEFTQERNCFTRLSDAARLTQVADTLCAPATVGRLTQVCERWIYSACLCFGLDLAEQEKTRFRYEYSVYQGEYSRNLLFRRGSELQHIFDGMVDRTRRFLDVRTWRTLFGAKKRPSRRRARHGARVEVVLERRSYDLTVFRIHFGKITAKLYTKGEHVLRSEVIVHNTKELRLGRSLPRFAEMVLRLQGILNRFLNVLHGVDVACISDTRLEEWPTPSQVGQTCVGGVDLNKPRMRRVLEAVMGLAAAPRGFRVSELAAKVSALGRVSEGAYPARHAAYDLKKLRGKNAVRRVGTSRRYETVPEGLPAMAALLVLREKVIKPVLAGAGKPKCGPKPKHQSAIDAHYRTLQLEMRNLFQELGLAV
jgi:hypothetical protein